MKFNPRPTSRYLLSGILLLSLLLLSGCDGFLNQDPTAVISYYPDPATGELPLTVAFDGSNSSDPEGPIIDYQWNFGDPDSEAENTSNKQNPNHEYAEEGTYMVSLTVTDEEGATGSTEIEVEVNSGTPPPNEEPTAVISYSPDPATGELPLTVEFDGSDSSDPDGTIVNYDWNFGDPDSGEDDNTSSQQNPEHEYATEGEFTVSLTVMDNDGSRDTEEIELQITDDDTPTPPPPP